VMAQDPAPGEPIASGGVCRLTLERAALHQMTGEAQP